MKKPVLLLVPIVALLFFLVLYKPIPKKEGKKALIVLFEGYQPIEFEAVKNILRKARIKTKILAVDREVDVKYDYYIENADFERLSNEFDAIILIGGPGVYERVVGKRPEPNMEKVFELVRKFYGKNKIVAAICASPAILAKAGILNGKRATVYPSDDLIKILRENGAIYTAKDVEVDGRVITARDPNCAGKFARKIVETI